MSTSNDQINYVSGVVESQTDDMTQETPPRPYNMMEAAQPGPPHGPPPHWPPPPQWQQPHGHRPPHFPPPHHFFRHPPPPGPRHHFNASIEINYRPTDVMVATFPRSGTTWTIEIIKQLHLRQITDENHPLRCTGHEGAAAGRGLFVERVSKEQAEASPSPRIFKTHSYYSDMAFISPEKKCKVIHVVRDPKDVFCSIFEHAKQMHGPHQTQTQDEDDSEQLQQFVADLAKGNRYQGPGPGDWWLFTKEFIENSYGLDILYIKYEDLKEETGNTISKINKFIGYPDMTQDEICEIINLTTHEKMQKTHINVHSKTTGTSGSHKKKLTSENVDEINKKIIEFLHNNDDEDLNLSVYCKV